MKHLSIFSFIICILLLFCSCSKDDSINQHSSKLVKAIIPDDNYEYSRMDFEYDNLGRIIDNDGALYSYDQNTITITYRSSKVIATLNKDGYVSEATWDGGNEKSHYSYLYNDHGYLIRVTKEWEYTSPTYTSYDYCVYSLFWKDGNLVKVTNTENDNVIEIKYDDLVKKPNKTNLDILYYWTDVYEFYDDLGLFGFLGKRSKDLPIYSHDFYDEKNGRYSRKYYEYEFNEDGTISKLCRYHEEDGYYGGPKFNSWVFLY